jgi:hypothetical protein
MHGPDRSALAAGTIDFSTEANEMKLSADWATMLARRSLMHHPGKAATGGKKMAAAGASPAAPKWPSYTGTSQFVGTSPSGRVTVFVDPTLGQSGLQNAQDLVSDADRVVSANDAIFGTIGGPVSVIVFALGGATDGTGGADHMACNYTTGNAIEADASFGNSARVSALFEAELSE